MTARYEQMGDYPTDRRRQTASTVADSLRSNPLPLALLTLGIGWLLLSTGEPSSARRAYNWAERRTARPRHRAAESLTRARHRAEEGWDEVAHRSAEQFEHWRHRGEEYADEARMRAAAYRSGGRGRTPRQGRFAEDYRERLEAQRQRLAERGGSYAGDIRSSAGSMTGSLGELIEDHPITAGLMGLALGAALGAALPHSRYEDEALGDYSDEVMRRGRSSGRSVAERARNVAEAAADAGVDAAREGARETGETARETMHETGEAAKSAAEAEAERQGLKKSR